MISDRTVFIFFMMEQAIEMIDSFKFSKILFLRIVSRNASGYSVRKNRRNHDESGKK